jgi:cell wall-associated NlpC family hydrolase
MSTPVISDLFLAEYRIGGRGDGVYDCFGLFAEVQRRAGVDVRAYNTPEDWATRESEILGGAEQWVKLDAPTPWCAVVFRIGRFVAHMGVVLEDCEHFIHADKGIGISKSRLDNPKWAHRIAGYYSHA